MEIFAYLPIAGATFKGKKKVARSRLKLFPIRTFPIRTAPPPLIGF